MQHIAGQRALLKGPQMFLIDTFLGQNGRRTFHFAAFIVAVCVTFLGWAATRFGILLPANKIEIYK